MASRMKAADQVISRADARAAGMSAYFTGKPCVRGHITTRFVSNKTCRDCFRAAQKKYVANNPEAAKARQKRHEEKVGASAIAAKYRMSYAKHREARLAAAKERRISLGEMHRAKNRQRMRKWREENPEAYAAVRAKYRALNPGAQRAYSHSRRIKTGAGMTAKQLSDWTKAQDKRCFYCDCACESTYHVDHIVPLSKGGEHQEWNLVIACAPCNLAKGACDASEFLDRIMMHHDSWPEA